MTEVDCAQNACFVLAPERMAVAARPVTALPGYGREPSNQGVRLASFKWRFWFYALKMFFWLVQLSAAEEGAVDARFALINSASTVCVVRGLS
eukprot:3194212-Amphidinium_carterae.1